MATVFEPSSIHHDNAVEITDIVLQANERTPSTIDFESDDTSQNIPERSRKKAQLKVVDELFGPLKIGSFLVTRVSLDALGATVDGRHLNGHNTFFRTPKRSFVNSLQFSSVDIEARMKMTADADNYLLPSLLFEIASRRPLTAPPMLKDGLEAQAEPDGYRNKLEKLLKSAQKLDIRHAHLPKKTPHWVNRVKSSSMAGTGVGLQAFGIYSGLRGLQDAIKNKDSYETIFNGASISAELTSIAVEVAVAQKATQMIKAGQSAYKDFAKTRFAVRLGRGGGLIASALTLPFDIICAVNSFNAAANATDKEAIDHYVSAGLSVTSAAMSIILGAAALAGFSFAGPVGLVAGLFLVAGSQIWAAIRAVDDIDDYIELTAHERLRTGWFAFWGISPDENIQNRHAIAKATTEHSKQLQAMARKLLDGELKDNTEVIVNGKFDVELKPTQIKTTSWWTGQEKYETVKRPKINDGDDTIDARMSVNSDTPGAVFGTPAEHKGVLWFIGGGRDTIIGTEKKPNSFHYGAGKKDLTGGEKDDEFIFEGAAELLDKGPLSSEHSKLKGGSGNDTLILAGKVTGHNKERWGYDIDLTAGTLSVIIPDPSADNHLGYAFHTLVERIENVETLAGATNDVKGTDGPNIIKSRGTDFISAGAGDDQIHLLNGNGSAAGGAGKDEYFIAHKIGNKVGDNAGHVSIFEDGADDSLIALDWRMDLIESWTIEEQQLVITSRFDLDDTHKKLVNIKEVYKQVGNQRQLKNNKLTFITKDGFHLTPELPEIIETDDPFDIEVIIIQQGITKKPVLLYNSEYSVAHDKNTNYFISRVNEHTTLTVKQHSRNALTTLYLDYASHELTRVAAHYSADLNRERDFDRILYKECDLTFHFDTKRLTIKNLASTPYSGVRQLHNRPNRLTAPWLDFNHHFILVMNDGVSYRAKLPDLPDSVFKNDMYRINGYMEWNIDVPLPLEPRKVEHLHHQPLDTEPHFLGTGGKCVKLTSYPEQTAIEHLEGEGSTYFIHLSTDMTLRISTPGAVADPVPKLPFASTWEFDATDLDNIDIKLVKKTLQIGGNVIHLPEYNNPEDLIDQVRVITSKGIIYAVDLLFEDVYIEGLDARYFDPPSDSATALPEAFSSIATRTLAVRNIAMRDLTQGTLTYSLPERRWTLDTDKSRTIAYTQLKVLNRCAHQLTRCHELVLTGLNSTPPIGAPQLQTVLDNCKILIENTTLQASEKLSWGPNMSRLLSEQTNHS